MKLTVQPHKITIDESSLVNEKEINITECEFEFVDIPENYVKEAYFTYGGNSYKVILENNECDIPSEVLQQKGDIEIGCVAYLVDGDNITRYNPSPVYVNTLIGSLKDATNVEPITPTDKEQMEQAIQDMETKVDYLDIDASKVDKTTTITITKKDGTQETTEILDGNDGKSLEYDWQGTELGIRQEGQSSYQYVDLKGDKGDAGAIKMEIVQELPSVGQDDTIYLVPYEQAETGNIYKEYIYVNGNWEQLGGFNTSVDLSDYVKNTDYAAYNSAGVLKANTNGFNVSNAGIPTASVLTAAQYVTAGTGEFISKGTLEVVLAAKHLETTNNKTTTIDNSSTDTEYPSAKAVYKEIEKTTHKIYSVIRKTDTESTTYIRTDDNVGMIANATHDGTDVVNTFDFVKPWSDIKLCNLDPTTKQVTAWYGENSFKRDGSNGDVMVYIPGFYYSQTQVTIDGISYDKISISDGEFDGSSYSAPFYYAAYDTAVVDSKPVSISGVGPEVNRNITSFRTLYTNNGYTPLDYRYLLVQLLYLVEYADNYTQNVLGNGITSVRYAATTTSLLAETGVNRIVIPTDTNFVVGNTICIGTSQGNMTIAKYRTITAINAYSENGVTGTELVFDGAAVNIAVGNWVGCIGQLSGQNDALGTKSGCITNDSKHAVSYRGIENWFGNVWQFVDGINIKDNKAYICTKPSSYQVDKFDGDYHALSYTNANSNNYAKVLGYDANYPFARFPISVGANLQTKYYTDYYYQNSGNRIARVGGNYGSGAYAGSFYWAFDAGSSYTDHIFGSRFLYIP